MKKKYTPSIYYTCLWCKKQFRGWVSQNRKFCSRPCQLQGRLARLEKRFWSYVIKGNTCWLWAGDTGRSGYGRFWYHNKTRQAHRISWMIFTGEMPPSNLMVCHICDIKACVNPEHLFLGTAKDNSHDRDNKGRTVSGNNHWTRKDPEKAFALVWSKVQKRAMGERAGNAKLTESLVREIRAMRSSGLMLKEISKMLSIPIGTIGRITTGRSWKHVLVDNVGQSLENLELASQQMPSSQVN